MTAPTIPTNAAELEEMLADSAKMQDLLKDTAKFGEFVANYGRTVMNKDDEIGKQVKAETQRVLAEWLKENGAKQLKNLNLSPETSPNRQHAAQYNAKAPGAKVDGVVDNWADFMRATWHRASTPHALGMQAKLHDIRNSFGSTIPADGGFLVPEVLRAELLRVSLESAIVRSRARVIPMDSLTVPFPTIDSTSNASSVYGGMTAYWTEEGAALVESSAKFGRVKLEAKKLTAYSEIPNELFQDSGISLQALISQIFPEAVAWFEDSAFFSGTGVGEPKGFLNAAAAVSVTAESGQAADTLKWENIVKMYSRMLPTSLGRAVWIANLDTFPQLATMALNVGTGGSAIWLNNGVEGPPAMILGRPVIFTEKAESVGDAGDINFVDFGYYLIGDRQTMQAESSPHYKFQNDKTSVRFIERVDGLPWLQSAITPKKGANTLSPFVKLAAR
ncbi:phage major capsid protein [Amycolatopsis sp. DSM 110486]|uniref:phage major capsid protein n=1 Tax=Amycolatopsis sp. DSM 110486 TaxID=2865832 RepID=UPI001C6A2618|nr:phage major capsid protein [Amycolatopsis sp. DSM 110486]QYN26693.1 phage major capsid protein [Amycolatopsis sp. DSM 110486]